MYFVDNLKSPYILLQHNVRLPSFSSEVIDKSAIDQYISLISPFLVGWFDGYSVLPEPRPKRDEGKIYTAKELHSFEWKGQKIHLLHLIRWEPSDLGGTPVENIFKPARQGFTASFLTNRAYFSQKFILVDAIYKEKGQIVDFNPLTLFSSPQYHKTSQSKLGSLTKLTSELFDEHNYQSLENHLQEQIARFQKEDWSILWKPGRVYSPIRIEYETVCFRPLVPFPPEIQNHVQSIAEGLLELIQFFESKTMDILKLRGIIEILKITESERTISPSGNMLWKIKIPDLSV